MAWLDQAFEHDADHGETDEGCDRSRVALEIAGEASISADPGERPLDDPSFWQDDEAVEIGALNDLEFPASRSGDSLRHFRPLVSGVGEDPLDEGKAPPRPAQQIARCVTVLKVGRQNAHAKEQTERVDENVTLAPGDFLARVITLWVTRRPDGKQAKPPRSSTARPLRRLKKGAPRSLYVAVRS